jgi:hypothetical protein
VVIVARVHGREIAIRTAPECWCTISEGTKEITIIAGILSKCEPSEIREADRMQTLEVK